MSSSVGCKDSKMRFFIITTMSNSSYSNSYQVNVCVPIVPC